MAKAAPHVDAVDFFRDDAIERREWPGRWLAIGAIDIIHEFGPAPQ